MSNFDVMKFVLSSRLFKHLCLLIHQSAKCIRIMEIMIRKNAYMLYKCISNDQSVYSVSRVSFFLHVTLVQHKDFVYLFILKGDYFNPSPGRTRTLTLIIESF